MPVTLVLSDIGFSLAVTLIRTEKKMPAINRVQQVNTSWPVTPSIAGAGGDYHTGGNFFSFDDDSKNRSWYPMALKSGLDIIIAPDIFNMLKTAPDLIVTIIYYDDAGQQQKVSLDLDQARLSALIGEDNELMHIGQLMPWIIEQLSSQAELAENIHFLLNLFDTDESGYYSAPLAPLHKQLTEWFASPDGAGYELKLHFLPSLFPLQVSGGSETSGQGSSRAGSTSTSGSNRSKSSERKHVLSDREGSHNSKRFRKDDPPPSEHTACKVCNWPIAPNPQQTCALCQDQYEELEEGEIVDDTIVRIKQASGILKDFQKEGLRPEDYNQEMTSLIKKISEQNVDMANQLNVRWNIILVERVLQAIEKHEYPDMVAWVPDCLHRIREYYPDQADKLMAHWDALRFNVILELYSPKNAGFDDEEMSSLRRNIRDSPPKYAREYSAHWVAERAERLLQQLKEKLRPGEKKMLSLMIWIRKYDPKLAVELTRLYDLPLADKPDKDAVDDLIYIVEQILDELKEGDTLRKKYIPSLLSQIQNRNPVMAKILSVRWNIIKCLKELEAVGTHDAEGQLSIWLSQVQKHNPYEYREFQARWSAIRISRCLKGLEVAGFHIFEDQLPDWLSLVQQQNPSAAKQFQVHWDAIKQHLKERHIDKGHLRDRLNQITKQNPSETEKIEASRNAIQIKQYFEELEAAKHIDMGHLKLLLFECRRHNPSESEKFWARLNVIQVKLCIEESEATGKHGDEARLSGWLKELRQQNPSEADKFQARWDAIRIKRCIEESEATGKHSDEKELSGWLKQLRQQNPSEADKFQPRCNAIRIKRCIEELEATGKHSDEERLPGWLKALRQQNPSEAYKFQARWNAIRIKRCNEEGSYRHPDC